MVTKKLYRSLPLAVAAAIGIAAIWTFAASVRASSTTKSLSTNFTVINLGDAQADGVARYIKSDGSEWRPSETFTVPARGQVVFRQYSPGPGYIPLSGQGSVIIEATQPLAAVVQIRAIDQIPTSGAYIGYLQGSSSFYVPLVARNRTTASGIANSQIIIQNTGSALANVEVKFIDWFTGLAVYTRTTGISINPGASYVYDLANETNLPTNWLGSAVVSAVSPGGQIAVISNFFTGPHGMQTFNAFPQGSSSQKWVVPLFVSRLQNGLSSPVTVQNLTNSSIPPGDVQMKCSVDATSPNQTPSTLIVTNTSPISPQMAYAWNPVIDLSLPARWIGSCVIESTHSLIAFVQLRFIGTDRAAAYEAIDASGGGTKLFVPLVAKRLPNGFASAVTIQNLDFNSSTQVTLTYQASTGYVPSSLVITRTIAPGGSLIQNHRVASDHPQGVPLPDNWQGSLTVESIRPIAAVVQFDFLGAFGDPYMAHNAFVLP